ncbi:unnamed protein product [Didymodactylos carnosus]|uniref:Uncharacterized protein n=1 Tax=Didymodactylos carnosus TaxID=1234261 RepID=A0A8S2E042_9BILA|nr:unnamed protein product [Didymodactylos carnosus]CAF3847518.1 unnamed protein product [Didymodactylos carnosus]
MNILPVNTSFNLAACFCMTNNCNVNIATCSSGMNYPQSLLPYNGSTTSLSSSSSSTATGRSTSFISSTTSRSTSSSSSTARSVTASSFSSSTTGVISNNSPVTTPKNSAEPGQIFYVPVEVKLDPPSSNDNNVSVRIFITECELVDVWLRGYEAGCWSSSEFARSKDPLIVQIHSLKKRL